MALGSLFKILATVFIAIIVAVWGIVLVQIWRYPTAEGTPPFTPNGELFLVAGALLTALATNTAAALGFSISEIKGQRNLDPTVPITLASAVSVVGYPVLLATAVYLCIGIAIAFTAWIPIGAGGIAALSVYAVTFFGWIIGALPVILKTPS